MKAIVYTQYGPPEVLHLEDVEKPVPRHNEILIKIRATAANTGDCRLRRADPWAVRLFFGLTKPKKNILGVVFSGEIESMGKDVKIFKTGDEVFGSTDTSLGTYAEYKCLPENGSVALKPGNATHEQAAAIPFGGTTALHFIKKANIKSGQKVLVYGASGAVGTAAVQLAKYFGAIVTGVCSTANVALVRSLGADKVIDYTKEDFTKNGETYDVVFDTVNKMPVSRFIDSLDKKGTLILSAAGLSEMLTGAWTGMTSSRKALMGMITETGADMFFLKGLVETGKLKPVIDRIYPLEQMAEAHAYVDKGHKKGNVVITIS